MSQPFVTCEHRGNPDGGGSQNGSTKGLPRPGIVCFSGETRQSRPEKTDSRRWGRLTLGRASRSRNYRGVIHRSSFLEVGQARIAIIVSKDCVTQCDRRGAVWV